MRRAACRMSLGVGLRPRRRSGRACRSMVAVYSVQFGSIFDGAGRQPAEGTCACGRHGPTNRIESTSMTWTQWPSLITWLTLVLLGALASDVARARTRYGIRAPATSGNEHFERVYRVHMN